MPRCRAYESNPIACRHRRGEAPRGDARYTKRKTCNDEGGGSVKNKLDARTPARVAARSAASQLGTPPGRVCRCGWCADRSWLLRLSCVAHRRVRLCHAWRPGVSGFERDKKGQQSALGPRSELPRSVSCPSDCELVCVPLPPPPPGHQGVWRHRQGWVSGKVEWREIERVVVGLLL